MNSHPPKTELNSFISRKRERDEGWVKSGSRASCGRTLPNCNSIHSRAVEMKLKGTPSKRGAVSASDRDVAFEWLAFLLYDGEVSCSNLGSETSYRHRCLLVFSQPLQANSRISAIMSRPLPSPSFPLHYSLIPPLDAVYGTASLNKP